MNKLVFQITLFNNILTWDGNIVNLRDLKLKSSKIGESFHINREKSVYILRKSGIKSRNILRFILILYPP